MLPLEKYGCDYTVFGKKAVSTGHILNDQKKKLESFSSLFFVTSISNYPREEYHREF